MAIQESRELAFGGKLIDFPIGGRWWSGDVQDQGVQPPNPPNCRQPQGLRILLAPDPPDPDDPASPPPPFPPLPIDDSQVHRLCVFLRPQYYVSGEGEKYNPIRFYGDPGEVPPAVRPMDWGSIYLKLKEAKGLDVDADGMFVKIDPVAGNTISVSAAGLLGTGGGGGGTPGDTIPVVVDEAGVVGTTTLFRRNDTRGGLKLRKNATPVAASGLQFASASKGLQFAIAKAGEDNERAATPHAFASLEVVPHNPSVPNDYGVQVKLDDTYVETETAILQVKAGGVSLPLSQDDDNQAVAHDDGLFVPVSPAVFVPDP